MPFLCYFIGMIKHLFKKRRSDFVQALLYLKGKPLRLDDRDYLLPVFNTRKRRVILKCGRQVEKSSTVAHLLIADSILINAFRTLYVSPSSMQTRSFSNEKLKPGIEASPLVRKYFTNADCIQQVFEKSFTNGSYIFLRYAFLTADRARGIPADRLLIDEIQDILKDNIVVILECLSHSEYGLFFMTGTPKTFENPIEDYWGLSTQGEWLVPCDHHTPRYWNFLDETNVGLKHLICDKCGKQIYPTDGQWVLMGDKESTIEGYRISQLMVPWKQDPERWGEEVVFKKDNYDEARFANEILGLSFDNAQKPISRMQLQQCCYPANQMDSIKSETFHEYYGPAIAGRPIFGGVDWGEGREEATVVEGKLRPASFTILTFGCYVKSNVFWVFYIKKFTGKETDPEFILKFIVNKFKEFRAFMLGVDYGHGWGVNGPLFKRLGSDKVVQWQYVGNQKDVMKWDQGGFKFQILRNYYMSQMFTALKEQRIMLPPWEIYHKLGKDILGIYSDYSHAMNMYYDHPKDQPDDVFHSMIYARNTADLYYEKRNT